MSTNLILHNVDASIALALRQRAESKGRSVEAKLLDILEEALKRPASRPFAEVLASMPNVGEDSDFNFRNQ